MCRHSKKRQGRQQCGKQQCGQNTSGDTTNNDVSTMGIKNRVAKPCCKKRVETNRVTVETERCAPIPRGLPVWRKTLQRRCCVRSIQLGRHASCMATSCAMYRVAQRLYQAPSPGQHRDNECAFTRLVPRHTGGRDRFVYPSRQSSRTEHKKCAGYKFHLTVYHGSPAHATLRTF